MKNTFKLMGIALLASAMVFTACKKDEEETTDSTNVTTPAIAVSFNGTAWTSDETMDYDGTNNYFEVYQTNADAPSIQFSCGMNVGVYALADTSNFVVYWDDNDEEYNTTSNDGTISITSIDPNAKTMTATIAATFILCETNYPLTVALTNAKWE